LPAGAYVIEAQGTILPREANYTTASCRLEAGTESSTGTTPLLAGSAAAVTVNAALTHVFAGAGTVTLSCSVTGDKWELVNAPGEGDTRIVATRVDSLHQSTAAAT
jgi:hypothetical protein